MTTPTYRQPEIRLCPSCLVNLGRWVDPDGLCPTCAQIAKEAGE